LDLSNSNLQLFSNIDTIDLEMMYNCLNGYKKKFSAGETIITFDRSHSTIGIVAGGVVRLERVDYFGDYTLLDRMEKNDIFGETLAYSNLANNEVAAVCEKDCEIIFVEHTRIIHPCEKVCGCHMTMLSNLLRIISNKAERLSLRVGVVSNKTIRTKLMSYFAIEAGKNNSRTFELPFSVSALADYICVDRSAMMREISKMKKEGLIDSQRRRITLLQ
jgi:CRP-like cAMP-binding protein